MGKRQLFSFRAKPYECIRLHRMLRNACKQHEGAQKLLNTYFANLCTRYGYAAPDDCQITIVAGYVFVHEPTPTSERLVFQV